MQYGTKSLPLGKISTPVTDALKIGTPAKFGVNKFANLFSEALELKYGNIKVSTGNKRTGWAEGNDWYVSENA